MAEVYISGYAGFLMANPHYNSGLIYIYCFYNKAVFPFFIIQLPPPPWRTGRLSFFVLLFLLLRLVTSFHC